MRTTLLGNVVADLSDVDTGSVAVTELSGQAVLALMVESQDGRKLAYIALPESANATDRVTSGLLITEDDLRHWKDPLILTEAELVPDFGSISYSVYDTPLEIISTSRGNYLVGTNDRSIRGKFYIDLATCQASNSLSGSGHWAYARWSITVPDPMSPGRISVLKFQSKPNG